MADTIAAIATAPGRAGVAVVRVSGPEAFAVARKITGREPEPGRFFYSNLAGVDDGIVLAFKAPHSYTGEDVVELQGHGGSVAPRRVLEACFASGARLARRGEFTERAFLNGRIDYEQAESVLELIDAKTDRSADAALAGLRGQKGKERRRIYEQALKVSTELEHALDIDDGELGEEFHRNIGEEIKRLQAMLTDAIKGARDGKLLRDGALVVLAGAPNSGKSSLMNALLGESRAIVSSIPGTTRDSIEEWLDVDGWPVRLVDTAGIRGTNDEIEAEGVRRSERLMVEAQVVLWLFDDRAGSDEAKRKRDRRTIAVGTKADLDGSVSDGAEVVVSSKTGRGLAELRHCIGARLAKVADEVPFGEMSHCEDALLIAQAELNRAMAECGDDMVLIANAIRGVTERLGEAVGAVYSSDLLDGLFSKFCIGK